jgi:hypothetical protein
MTWASRPEQKSRGRVEGRHRDDGEDVDVVVLELPLTEQIPPTMAIALLTPEQQKRATDKLIQWIEIDKRIVSLRRSVPPASNSLWL